MDVVLLVVAAATIALWFLLLGSMAASTRTPSVHAGPPTDELGSERPAIVDLITGNWRLCDEAASGTLLDLAARGALTIEEIGPELALVRLRSGGPAIKLNSYERMVYDHVAGLAIDGVVATGALTEGARNLGRWWTSFRKNVIAEARELGLSVPRWTRRHAVLLRGAAFVPAVAVAIGVGYWSYRHTEDGDAIYGLWAGVGVLFLLNWLLTRMNAERGTALGAHAAGYWLGVREHLAGNRQFPEQPAAAVTIWGRALAYAAVLGLARRAVVSLPISEPADDSRAWSDYTGMWRVVDVRYPSRLWGRRPLPVLFGGLATGAMSGFFVWILLLTVTAIGVLPWPEQLITPTALAAGVLVAAVPIWRAIADLVGQTMVEGKLVRRRQFTTGSSNNRRTVYRVAIDEGRSNEIKAYGIGIERWNSLTEGDLVRAQVGRHLGWVTEIEVVQPSRQRRAADDQYEAAAISAPESLAAVAAERPPDGLAALVTAADLHRALGLQVDPNPLVSAATPVPGGRSWRYHTVSGTYTTVDVHYAKGWFSRFLMVLGQMQGGQPGRPLPGYGTAAMLYANAVAVQTRAGTVAVQVSSSAGPPRPEGLVELARIAAGRLSEPVRDALRRTGSAPCRPHTSESPGTHVRTWVRVTAGVCRGPPARARTHHPRRGWHLSGAGIGCGIGGT